MAVFNSTAKSRPILSIMCVVALSVCAAVLTLAAVYLYLNPQIPDASTYRNVKLETPLRVLSKEGDLLAEFGERRLIPITMDKVPNHFVRALVDTEDKRFYSHQGVDFISLLNDSMELFISGEIKSGASTLTMQLARNVSFSLEQRFIRKFKEMLLAMKIERQLSKDEILNLYINIVPFGKRAYGAEAAAQTYYQKPLNELSLAQLAMLAGIPQAPSTGNPVNGPERAVNRRNLVLGRMLAEGSITRPQYEEASAAPITARILRQGSEIAAPYPAEIVRQELKPQYDDLYTGGYSVTTTINSALQKTAVAAVREGLHGYDERHGYRGATAKVDLPDQPDFAKALVPLDEATKAAQQVLEATRKRDKTAQLPELPLPVLPAIGEELSALISTELTRVPLVGDQQPGVVLAVGERSVAVAITSADERGIRAVVIPWQGLNWARPFISVDNTGPYPQSAGAILRRGDVIYLRGAPRWRLSEEPQAQGALVSLDPTTGAIQALTGGYDFSRNQFNHAIQARRQPGSGFKPFVYSAALARGITPASIYMDAPIVLEDDLLETQYRPNNDNKRYNGPTRLREALYRSINLVSIRVLLDVGAGRALRHVKRFGFDTSDFPRNTQLGVGGGTMGVTPMDMARAYSVFASSGHLIEPHLITSVSRDDVVLETRRYPSVCKDCTEEELTNTFLANDAEALAAAEETPAPDEPSATDLPFEEAMPAKLAYAPRVLDEDNAWVMHTMLQDVIKRGTGRRANALERTDLAGKTGTTNEAADTWFNGYNGELVTTVWVGFSDYRPLGAREFGATTPLPIWVDYMGTALEGRPTVTLDQPSSVVSLKIDPETGEVARPGQSNALFEYFLEDFQPERSTELSPAVFEGDSTVESIETTELF